MRKKIVITGIAIIVVICGVLCFLPSTRVRYHHARMLRAFDNMYEIGGEDTDRYVRRFDRHRDALVRLGFFEHKIIPLRHIYIPSDQHKALFRELNDNTRIESAFFLIREDEVHATGEVELWATPEEMPELLQIVSKHDKEPST